MALPDLSTPDALANAAARALLANAAERDTLHKACQSGPMGRARVISMVEGREIRLGINGYTGRGKSTALRGLAVKLRAMGGLPTVSLEVDRDGAGAGQGDFVRIPVSLQAADVGDSEEVDPDKLRRATKAVRQACIRQVMAGAAKGARFMHTGEACAMVFESMSALWRYYYDLVQQEFPEGHEDAFGRERGAAYRECYKAVAYTLQAAQAKDTAWAVAGPIVAAVVCHAKPVYAPKPKDGGPARFEGWTMAAGPSMVGPFVGAVDYNLGFGMRPTDPPESIYPPKGGFYACYTQAQHPQCKARIDTPDEVQAAERFLSKADLANFVEAIYLLRRARAFEALKANT
jgi:hypothetical protein